MTSCHDATYENFIGIFYNFRFYVKKNVMSYHTNFRITLKHHNDSKKKGCVDEFLINMDVLYYQNKRKL